MITVTQAEALITNIQKVIVGKEQVIRTTVCALLAGGHVLLEDVPGVGKTMLARALAKSIAGRFRRIQFTPDLMPSDITGVSMYNQLAHSFEFMPGPVFTNVLLADEINRATPRTQSSLLEAMEEGRISIEGETHPLPPPFFVIATQNPIEYQGTFPLPESQMDRFLIALDMGYPSAEEEATMLDRQQQELPIDHLQPVIDAQTIVALQDRVRQVHVSGRVIQYIVTLAAATRKHLQVILGVSPRGSLSLLHLAQAESFMSGRDFVLPDDVKKMAVPAFSHRLICHANSHRQKNRYVIEELLAEVPVPA